MKRYYLISTLLSILCLVSLFANTNSPNYKRNIQNEIEELRKRVATNKSFLLDTITAEEQEILAMISAQLEKRKDVNVTVLFSDEDYKEIKVYEVALVDNELVELDSFIEYQNETIEEKATQTIEQPLIKQSIEQNSKNKRAESIQQLHTDISNSALNADNLAKQARALFAKLY